MAYQGKVYKMVESENLKEFLLAIGIDESKITDTTGVNATTALNDNGDDTYTLTVEADDDKFEVTFKLGEKVIENRSYGELESVFTLDGDTLTQVQKMPNGKLVAYVKEFKEDSMDLTATVDDATSGVKLKAKYEVM